MCTVPPTLAPLTRRCARRPPLLAQGEQLPLWGVRRYQYWDEASGAWVDEQPPACLVTGLQQPGAEGWRWRNGSPRSAAHCHDLYCIYDNLWCAGWGRFALLLGGAAWHRCRPLQQSVAAVLLLLQLVLLLSRKGCRPEAACCCCSYRPHVRASACPHSPCRFNNGRFYLLVDGEEGVVSCPLLVAHCPTHGCCTCCCRWLLLRTCCPAPLPPLPPPWRRSPGR